MSQHNLRSAGLGLVLALAAFTAGALWVRAALVEQGAGFAAPISVILALTSR